MRRSITATIITAVLTLGASAMADDMAVKGPSSIVLPPQPHDLSIRFVHHEPRVEMTDLIAYWPFDEGSGYKFLDASGGGHTAYITGHNWNTSDSGLTASFHRQGRRGGAVYLNGTQWLQVKNTQRLQHLGELTVSAWLRPDGDPMRSAGQVILSHMSGGKGYALLLEQGGTLRFVVGDNQGSLRKATSQEGVVQKDRWVHVLATGDPKSGQLRVYVNGALSGRADGGPFTPGTADSDLRHGASSDGQGAFKGWLDDVALQARVLSAAEARELYAVGFPKVYVQSRETIDAERTVWTRYKGNAPVPHPVEEDTAFLLTFDGTLDSVQGHAPLGDVPSEDGIVPGVFGGAFDATKGGLRYVSPITASRGTTEAWFIPVLDPSDPKRRAEKVLFRAEGEEGWLELLSSGERWVARIGRGDSVLLTAASSEQTFVYGTPVHLGVTWDTTGENRGTLALYLNGVEVARAEGEAGPLALDRQLLVGGSGASGAHGHIDDLRVSREVRGWGQVGPRGHVLTEAAPLDLMDGFDRQADEPLWLWLASPIGSGWRYAHKPWEDNGSKLGDSGTLRRSLEQTSPEGRHLLFHPDAYGEKSSIEAGVSFGRSRNGWAGVFIQAPSVSAGAFSGHTFALNPATNTMRLTTLVNGTVLASKALPYDFKLRPGQTYTMTLTSATAGVLRGYLDGHNLISLRFPEGASAGGFAGLMTEDSAAHFDDVHVSALTPSTRQSRRLQVRLFSDGSEREVGYAALSLSAFRWNKRHGLLPWQRTYKDPQPPGAIFGADDGVERPNPPQPWRSHDSANSEVLAVDDTVYYFMRGNPHLGNLHGPAAIGVLTAPSDAFTGIHFKDQNAGIKDLNRAQLLRGHEDTAPVEARDQFPRDTRLQVNDQGATYLDGRIVVMAREFRNRQGSFPWFRRLVYGLYDVKDNNWLTPVGRTVDWSSQSDPDDPFSAFSGIDATPEITALRDPKSDAYTLFLFHHHRTLSGVPTTGVTGLRFQGNELILLESYPTRETYIKLDVDTIYGERIFFDNGIYYMHYNAGPDFDYAKLGGDWPDRFHLASSLHPYAGPWTTSSENHNPERAYFTRGGEFDFDNAAIWQGTVLKHRGRYSMYYENFHAIDDVNAPYQFYDDIQTGSRVGYATAN